MGALVSSAFGGGMNAIADLRQGDQRSQILQDDAAIQQKNATLARAAGAYNSQRQQILAGEKIGAAQASYGASGVTSDSGSAMDVLRQSHTNAEMDRMNIVYGSEIEAQNYENKSSAEREGATRTQADAKFNAWIDFFGGASKGLTNYAGDSGGSYSDPAPKRSNSGDSPSPGGAYGQYASDRFN